MIIDICSTSDIRGLDRVYILLNSIKHSKQPDTIINYKLVVEEVTEQITDYFKELQSDDFYIDYIDIEWFRQRINPPRGNIFYYLRLLFPFYFTRLDKLLYLDTDLVFINGGIEELWETDITNYYLGAVVDIPVARSRCLFGERVQTHNTQYYNTGVMLMNLKKIRQSSQGEEIKKWCLQWDRKKLNPILHDQTLLNYLFKYNDIYSLDYRFNDYSLMISNAVKGPNDQYLFTRYGYRESLESVKRAVILHFLGEIKPWAQISEQQKKCFPYANRLFPIWNQITKKLSKKNGDE